jgi:hypothetical protein
MSMQAENSVLSWLHLGDLRITEADEANHRAVRLRRMG